MTERIARVRPLEGRARQALRGLCRDGDFFVATDLSSSHKKKKKKTLGIGASHMVSGKEPIRPINEGLAIIPPCFQIMR